MLKSHDRDLLHGSLVRKILEFTGPLIITNLVYTLYNAADMVIVGLSGVEGAIGAIGTTVALIHLMLNIFNGLSLGSGIIVARYIGEGNPEKIGKAVHTSMITGLFSGLICMTAGLLLSRPTLWKQDRESSEDLENPCRQR